MYRNILVPIAPDHGLGVTSAIDVALLLADGEGKITALTVAEAMPAYVTQLLPPGLLEKTRDELLTALRADVGGVKNIKSKVVIGHSGRTIVEYADQYGIDCIVIASHRPGLQDYFLGSTAARVVRHAKCAVHVIR